MRSDARKKAAARWLILLTVGTLSVLWLLSPYSSDTRAEINNYLPLGSTSAEVDFSSIRGKSPEEVYKIYYQALLESDLDTMYLCTSNRNRPGSLKQYRKHMARLASMMRVYEPREVKVISKDLNGDVATLHVQGFSVVSKTGKKKIVNGRVKMLLENGEWKVDKEQWE